MNLLSWFDSRDAVQFAKTVAQEIRSLSPLESRPWEKGPANVKEMKKMEKLFSRIYTFSREKKLNVYTKARFLNTLRWEMTDYGYPPDHTNHLIGVIATKL
jgi:hypothetical protein